MLSELKGCFKLTGNKNNEKATLMYTTITVIPVFAKSLMYVQVKLKLHG